MPLSTITLSYVLEESGELCCSPPSSQNPLSFVLRAALIYPNKVALVHPNAQAPVIYTYGVWYCITPMPVMLSLTSSTGPSAYRILPTPSSRLAFNRETE